MFFRHLLLFTLSLTSSQSVFASNIVGESIYFLELLVIAIVALALIFVTISIAKSKNKIKQVVSDIREEMAQEKAMLQMAMIKVIEKEKQISYMAHLLQEHLESRNEVIVADENAKKKKTKSW